MNQGQVNAATNECVKQSEQQIGKGGSIITCFLTFGSKFSTDDTATLRAVYKCFTSKPEKSPGGKEWEKQNNMNRVIITCKYSLII